MDNGRRAFERVHGRDPTDQLVAAGGCARKLAAEDLMKVLREIEPFPHPWVDTSVGSMEDAAILRPPSGPALVFTVDFITPIVDDPETFGAIAATNALSDVYAMGGEPQAALAVCGFPSDRLPSEILEARLPRRPRQGGRGGLRDRRRAHDQGRRAEVRAVRDRRAGRLARAGADPGARSATRSSSPSRSASASPRRRSRTTRSTRARPRRGRRA